MFLTGLTKKNVESTRGGEETHFRRLGQRRRQDGKRKEEEEEGKGDSQAIKLCAVSSRRTEEAKGKKARRRKRALVGWIPEGGSGVWGRREKGGERPIWDRSPDGRTDEGRSHGSRSRGKGRRMRRMERAAGCSIKCKIVRLPLSSSYPSSLVVRLDSPYAAIRAKRFFALLVRREKGTTSQSVEVNAATHSRGPLSDMQMPQRKAGWRRESLFSFPSRPNQK